MADILHVCKNPFPQDEPSAAGARSPRWPGPAQEIGVRARLSIRVEGSISGFWGSRAFWGLGYRVQVFGLKI